MEFALAVFGIEGRPHPALRKLVELGFQFGVEPIDVVDIDVDVVLAAPVVKLALGQDFEQPDGRVVTAEKSVVVGGLRAREA